MNVTRSSRQRTHELDQLAVAAEEAVALVVADEHDVPAVALFLAQHRGRAQQRLQVLVRTDAADVQHQRACRRKPVTRAHRRRGGIGARPKIGSGPSLTTAIESSRKPNAAAIWRRASFDTVTMRSARRIASRDLSCQNRRERQWGNSRCGCWTRSCRETSATVGVEPKQRHEGVARGKQNASKRAREGAAHPPEVRQTARPVGRRGLRRLLRSFDDERLRFARKRALARSVPVDDEHETVLGMTRTMADTSSRVKRP